MFKKIRVLALGLIILTAMTTMACAPSSQQSYEKRIDHIVRIIMQSETNFTLFVQIPDSQELHIVSARSYGSPTKIFTDVTPDQKMWALSINRSIATSAMSSSPQRSLELHVHDLNDIEGMGMRQRKTDPAPVIVAHTP